MPQYTLHYFNVRGLGELTRLIFVQAQQEFTDHRIEMNEWAEEKKNSARYPLGVAPTLDVDGNILPESLPIARYVATEFGLAGKDNLEKAWCDIIVDLSKELRNDCKPFMPFYKKETDEAKLEELKEAAFSGSIAKKLASLEGFLKSNNEGKGFFVGDGVTWADLAFIDYAEVIMGFRSNCLDNTPLLKSLYERVRNLPNLKAYLEKRPKTIM